MKDISIYFEPINPILYSIEKGSIGEKMDFFSTSFPELQKGDVALIYVPEYRGATHINEIEQKQADSFRQFLPKLYQGANWKSKLVDLGNILPGATIQDTYFALTSVLEELIKHEIFPIVIGGSQDLTYAQYKAYEKLEQTINLVCVDASFDFGNEDEDVHSNGFLRPIIMSEPSYLFNYSNVGYQSYFTKPEEIELLEKLYFDCCRLGTFNQDFRIAEPLLRNCDLLSMDILSARYSDFSSSYNDSPNGFYGEQLCQIARYAGISDKLTSFGLYNLFPDRIEIPANHHLIAQIIWHLLDGINNRKGDFPIGSKANYTKFNVHLDDFKDEIVFYKSDKTDRWWMEVPYPVQPKLKYERHYLVPCNYEDYQRAMQNDVPDLWWKTYQKLC